MAPLDTVGGILNEAQRSASAHRKLFSALLALYQKDPDAVFADLLECLKHLLLVEKREPPVERVLAFITMCVTRREAGLEEHTDALLCSLLAALVPCATSPEKAVRVRTCQLIYSIFQVMDDDVEMDEAVCDGVTAALVARLRDRAPAARQFAALALARLQDPSESSPHSACAALSSLLAAEKVAAVRKAAVGSLAVATSTLPALVARTRDASESVRAAVYIALAAKCPAGGLTIAQRAVLIRRGLRDRSAGVRAAAGRCVLSWMEAEGGSPLSLLSLLDCESHPETARVALAYLLGPGGCDAVKLVADGAAAALRPAPGAPLATIEEASLARAVCASLAAAAAAAGGEAACGFGAVATVAAAAADAALSSLESALPITAQSAVALAAAHAMAAASHSPGGGRRVAAEMVGVLEFLDWTDGTAHRAGCALLDTLVGEDPCPVGVGAEGHDAVAGGGGRLMGAGGDGRWEQAVAAAGRKIHGGGAAWATALCHRLESVAVAWGMTADEGETRDACDPGDGPKWAQWLTWAALALEDGGATTAAAVVPWAVSGMRHPMALVRQSAARCLGHVALSSTPATAGNSVALRLLRLAAASDATMVRAAALESLCDAALVFGPPALDGGLPLPGAPGSLPGDDPIVETLFRALFCEEGVDGGDDDDGDGDGGDGTGEAPPGVEPCPRAVAAEGLAKLLLFGRLPAGDAAGGAMDSGMSTSAPPPPGALLAVGQAERAIVYLAGLYFSAGAAALPRCRQMLAVFFGAFAATGAQAKATLARSLLPALRAAASGGGGTKQAAAVANFFLAHLQAMGAIPTAHVSGHDDDDDNTTTDAPAVVAPSPGVDEGALAAALLAEAGRCGGGGGVPRRAYVTTCIRTAAKLRPRGGPGAAAQAAVKHLRWLVSCAGGKARDRVTQRALSGLATTLESLDLTPRASPEDILADEGPAGGGGDEMAAAIVAVRAGHAAYVHSLTDPAPFGGDDDSDGGGEDTDDEDDDDDDDGGRPVAAKTALSAPVDRPHRAVRPSRAAKEGAAAKMLAAQLDAEEAAAEGADGPEVQQGDDDEEGVQQPPARKGARASRPALAENTATY